MEAFAIARARRGATAGAGHMHTVRQSPNSPRLGSHGRWGAQLHWQVARHCWCEDSALHSGPSWADEYACAGPRVGALGVSTSWRVMVANVHMRSESLQHAAASHLSPGCSQHSASSASALKAACVQGLLPLTISGNMSAMHRRLLMFDRRRSRRDHGDVFVATFSHPGLTRGTHASHVRVCCSNGSTRREHACDHDTRGTAPAIRLRSQRRRKRSESPDALSKF